MWLCLCWQIYYRLFISSAWGFSWAVSEAKGRLGASVQEADIQDMNAATGFCLLNGLWHLVFVRIQFVTKIKDWEELKQPSTHPLSVYLSYSISKAQFLLFFGNFLSLLSISRYQEFHWKNKINFLTFFVVLVTLSTNEHIVKLLVPTGLSFWFMFPDWKGFRAQPARLFLVYKRMSLCLLVRWSDRILYLL